MNAELDGCAHCWHPSGHGGGMHTSNGQWHVFGYERCCFCGTTRRYESSGALDERKHGPYQYAAAAAEEKR